MAAITIVAHIKAKTDQDDLVKSELEKLIDITRADEGCSQYDLHQGNDNTALFLFRPLPRKLGEPRAMTDSHEQPAS